MNKTKEYKYIIMLRGTNKKLAELELKNLISVYYEQPFSKITLEHLENQIYLLKTDIEFEKEKNHNFQEIKSRLTLTNIISRIIYEETNNKFIKTLKTETNAIEKIIKKLAKKRTIEPFLVRIKKTKKKEIQTITEKELAKKIWNALENPKVSIKQYKTKFILFTLSNNQIYLTYELFENKKEYLKRMPKNRPEKMPYTLKSDLARTTINLLNKKKGILYEPFCGIGGIVLEMLDMNYKVICNDISYNDLIMLQKNITHYFKDKKDKNYTIILSDAKTKTIKDNSIEGIVTDIPYGRCSRKLGNELYKKFLENSYKILKPDGRMVLIYANFCNIDNYINRYFKEIYKIEEYINSSMTRIINILEPKKIKINEFQKISKN